MPKKQYNTEEIGVKFRAYVEKNFDSSAEAAYYYASSSQSLSNIYRGQQAPTPAMLADMGFQKIKKTWFEKV